MAQAASLWVRLGLSDSDFDRGLKQAENKLNRFGSRLSTLGSRITTGISLPFLAAGAASVKMAADMETTTVAFTTLLGSADKAQKQLNQLKAFAASTPFQFTELTDATRRMLAFGFSAEQVVPMMRVLGNAISSLGLGKDGIDRATIALGQMQAKERVMTQEMNQLTEIGISAWKYLADSLHTDVAGAMDMVEKRMVSGAQGVSAVLAGMGKDPKFKDGMEKQMNTINGLWSNFLDTLKFGLADLGNEIAKGTNLKEVLKSFTDGIKEFTAWFAKLDPWVKNAIVKFTLLAAALGPLLLVVGKIITAWSAMIGIMRLLPATALVTGLKSIVFAFQAVAGGAATAGEAMGMLAASFAPFLATGVIVGGLFAIFYMLDKVKNRAKDAMNEIANISTMSDALKKQQELADEYKRLQNQKTNINKFEERQGGSGAVGQSASGKNIDQKIKDNVAESKALQKKIQELKNGTKPGTPSIDKTLEELLKSFKSGANGNPEGLSEDDSTMDGTLASSEWWQQREEAVKKIRLASMEDGKEKELFILNDQYQEELALAEEYQIDTTELTEKYNADRLAIEEKYAEKNPWQKGLEETMKDWENWSLHVEDIASQTAYGMERSFSDFFVDALHGELKSIGDYFQSFVDSIINAWAQAMAQMATKNIMSNAFGNWMGGLINTGTSAGSSLPGNYGIEGRAIGGPVSAGTSYIVGEKGPELFTPQMSGNITSNDKLGGSKVIINVINNSSEKVTQNQRQGSNGVNITDIIIGTVSSAISTNKGGLGDMIKATAGS